MRVNVISDDLIDYPVRRWATYITSVTHKEIAFITEVIEIAASRKLKDRKSSIANGVKS